MAEKQWSTSECSGHATESVEWEFFEEPKREKELGEVWKK